jgi:hypothetical protein
MRNADIPDKLSNDGFEGYLLRENEKKSQFSLLEAEKAG